jgi:hypothetical protein
MDIRISWVYVRLDPMSLEITFCNHDMYVDSLSKLLFLFQLLLKTHDVYSSFFYL